MPLNTPDGHSVELGFSIDAGKAIDMSRFRDPYETLYEVAGDLGVRRETASSMAEKKQRFDWLPFAAESYHINPDLSNYAIVPVTIMNSDLPNRNLVAFPFERLTEWNPTTCSLNYQTFRGVPCFLDHANQNITEAKGVVLDVGLRKVPNVEGDLWKVVTLGAIDRTRDARVASMVMSGDINSYSMGAYVKGYTCSICGSTTDKPTSPRCMHIPPNRKTLNVFRKDGREELAYWKCGPFKGFELSALLRATPGAFPSTDNTAGSFVVGA